MLFSSRISQCGSMHRQTVLFRPRGQRFTGLLMRSVRSISVLLPPLSPSEPSVEDIADIGEVTLRRAAQRLRRNAIQKNDAEFAVRPAGRRTGVEFFPPEMKHRIRCSTHTPVRDNMRMLSDQRQAFIRGARCQFEKQQRRLCAARALTVISGPLSAIRSACGIARGSTIP